MIINFVLVGIGGGLGAFLRAWITEGIKKIWYRDYPLATFLINVTGAFILGVLISFQAGNLWMLLFGTGLMGGYTTFSTFNYELITLMKSGRKKTSLLYELLSVLCGLAAAAVGMNI
jgi:fluoride exporter